MTHLFNLNMDKVKEHYLQRVSIHDLLVSLLLNNQREDYVRLAIGASDIDGNYSASACSHDLRPAILAHNKPDIIFSFANSIYIKNCRIFENLKSLIYNEYNLPYIKISVGSEMAMMLRPNDF
jgi:hypothetical protein